MFRRHRTDLIEARNREVAALKFALDMAMEQIEYLRTLMGQPSMSRAQSKIPAEFQLPSLEEGLAAYLSEEEEDLIALRDAGHINELELEEQLARAGLRNPHLTLAT